MKAAAATNCMRLLVLLIHAPAHQVDGHRLQQPAAAAAVATTCLAALRSTSGPETDCGPPDHCDACRVAAAIAAGCSQGEAGDCGAAYPGDCGAAYPYKFLKIAPPLNDT